MTRQFRKVRTLAFHICLFALLPGIVSAYNTKVVIFDGKAYDLRWKGNQVTLKAGKDSFPSGNAYRNALPAIISRYNKNPSNFEYSLQFGDKNVGLDNDENEIWTTSSIGPPASADYRYNTSGKLIEVDVRVDPTVNWTAGVTKSNLTPYGGVSRPFRNVVIHEIGHGVGLGHETETYNAMGEDWDHIHANGPRAPGYLGEDSSEGAVDLYGLDSTKGEDLSVTHWRHTGSSDGYSTHARTRIFDLSDNELTDTSSGDEPRYRVDRGNTVKIEFTYENSGVSSHSVDVGFYLSNGGTITTRDRHLKSVAITLDRDSVWTKTYEVPIPEDLLPKTDYALGVIVDEKDNVDENWEANNATYIDVRTDGGTLPDAFTQWLGTYQGRIDGREALLTITKDTSGVPKNEGAAFNIQLEDEDRKIIFTGGADYENDFFHDPVRHEIRPGTLSTLSGKTKNLYRLLIHTWDNDFISGVTKSGGDLFGAGFVRNGPKATLLTDPSGSKFDTNHPKAAWAGFHEGQIDGKEARLVINSTDVVSTIQNQKFLKFEVQLNSNKEFTGDGFVPESGPLHLMRFFNPLSASDGTEKEIRRLLLHNWDQSFISGYSEWKNQPFGMLFARNQIDYNGILHQGIGKASINVNNEEYLEVFELGKKGQDGVTLNLDKLAKNLKVSLQNLALNHTGSSVAFLPTRDVSSDETASVNEVILEREEEQLRLSSDFSPIGASNTKFEILRNSELVQSYDEAQELLISAGPEGMPNIKSTEARTDFGENAATGVILELEGIGLFEPAGETMSDAIPVEGNAVRILPQNPTTQVRTFNGMRMLGANLETLRINEETFTPAVTYQVSFDIGEHGIRIGGGKLMQTIPEGSEATVPAIEPEEGWKFTGWETSFKNVTQDLTVRAMYRRTGYDWLCKLRVDGAGTDYPAVSLGMHPDAFADNDIFDTAEVGPSAETAAIYFEQQGTSYSRDIRPAADNTAEWFLVVQAGSEKAIKLNWDISSCIPDNKYLSMFAVDSEHRPVNGTFRNMGRANQLSVPAGKMRFYVIRYGPELSVDIRLRQGWNFISLPFEPSGEDNSIASVFQDTVETDNSGSSDTTTETVYSNAVWKWVNKSGDKKHQYVQVEQVTPLIAYWLYAENSIVFTVKGIPVQNPSVTLNKGWNGIGVNAPMPVPAKEKYDLSHPIWNWNPAQLAYELTEKFRSTRGYWLYAGHDVIEIELPDNPTAQVSPDAFVGTWINDNEDTNGITKVVIGRSGDDMTVHVYAQCSPSDCDWGSVTEAYTGNPFTAVFEQGFKTTTLTIELVDTDALHIHSQNVFHDGSDRDYEADYQFHR